MLEAAFGWGTTTPTISSSADSARASSTAAATAAVASSESVVGHADPADRLFGVRGVAVRDDRDGARSAVQQPLAGAARRDPSQPPGVR